MTLTTLAISIATGALVFMAGYYIGKARGSYAKGYADCLAAGHADPNKSIEQLAREAGI